MPTAPSLSRSPLQVIIFRHADDLDTKSLEDAVINAFKGGPESGGYLATGEDLRVDVAAFGARAPALSVTKQIERFCHTLVIVLVDRAFIDVASTDPLWQWLAEYWRVARDSDGQQGLLVLPTEERQSREFIAKHASFANLQIRSIQDLGEPAIRPATFALQVLHTCRVLIARAIVTASVSGEPPGYLRLFISHAKMDGLPLAHALKHQIESLPWLRSFYDAKDIPPGADWERELERGVGSSLIVMLRTDFYDSRYWCQQEVRWADEYATPAVLIDARTKLSLPPAALPFDRVPTARIPDGNLIRVLFLALREGLRHLEFVRRVEEMKRVGELPKPVELRVFSFAPSMPALLRALRTFGPRRRGKRTPRIILYPDPPLSTGQYEAAHALVARYARDVALMTPDSIVARGAKPWP